MSNEKPEFRQDYVPLAFFISFRCFGTWLHGDERGSVDRNHNIYGRPRLGPERARVRYEKSICVENPYALTLCRESVERAIRETCRIRQWCLWAVNVRTNHVHAVITASSSSKKLRAALKANATRTMREDRCWNDEGSPWAHRGSRRNLWTEAQLNAAIAYVLYDQGEPLDSIDN